VSEHLVLVSQVAYGLLFLSWLGVKHDLKKARKFNVAQRVKVTPDGNQPSETETFVGVVRGAYTYYLVESDDGRRAFVYQNLMERVKR
jgi:hypothetical protein